MRNQGAVSIKKASTAVGLGLLEMALETEGRKGCSPVLCLEPVSLEPGYERFDSDRILRLDGAEPDSRTAKAATDVDWLTLEVFPSEEDVLALQWMETALRALSILDGPFAFELVGNSKAVNVRFGLPAGQQAGFRAALIGHFPALALREAEEPFREGPVAAVEELVPVGPYHRSLTLLGHDGASPLGLATTALHELPETSTGALQVLLQPADAEHDWHYNVENLLAAEERAAALSQFGGISSKFAYDSQMPPLMEPAAREKVREDVAFFGAVFRYALWSGDDGERERFEQAMRVATGMVRFGNRAWRRLEYDTLHEVLGEQGTRELVTQRRSHRPGLMLTSKEIATFVHVPNEKTLALFQTLARREGLPWNPFADEVGDGSSTLGMNEYVGSTQPVEVPLWQRLRHTYILGTTGYGKSQLILRMAADDAAAGVGFCLVDPHGDLCLDMLSRIPEDRFGDVTYISFGEPGHVPVWNPFASEVQPGKLADDITRAFLAQTSSRGARMEHNFRMLSYVVSRLGGTLNDFAEMAERTTRGKQLREQALARIANPQVRRFLTAELPSYSAGDVRSVTNKLSPLLLDDQLGAMFTQPDSQLSPRAWMDDGRIVLVNLSSGQIGADHARIVGSLLVSLVYRAAVSRSDVPAAARRPFLLYVDEFQQLQAATLSELLSEGRKYAIGAVLAHQERGQLGKELAQSLGNCGTKVIFRPGEDDYAHSRKVLGGRVTDQDLQRLTVGQAFVACGAQVASLRTELTAREATVDPRAAVREYVAEHYLPLGAEQLPAAPRPMIYDTFGEEEP